jgi:hypothetical protein
LSVILWPQYYGPRLNEDGNREFLKRLLGETSPVTCLPSRSF